MSELSKQRVRTSLKEIAQFKRASPAPMGSNGGGGGVGSLEATGVGGGVGGKQCYTFYITFYVQVQPARLLT